MNRLVLIAASVLAMSGATSAMNLRDAIDRAHQAPDCKLMGEVYHLDPNGDNNLSVRASPAGPAGLAYELDELFTGQVVCITAIRGVWAHVFYIKGDRTGAGWVHSAYVSVQ